MAEEILKTHDLSFCSRPLLLAFRKISYDGFDIALAPYGEYWREMRKTCMLHLLSAVREVSRMIQKISQHISLSETINLTKTLTFFTRTTICRVAFGKRYEPGSGESKEFNQIIREFQMAVDKLVGKIDHLENICKKWDLFYQQLVDEHLLPDRPKSMDGDVVDIMLQLREETSMSSDLPLDHIKAALMDVYFASTDTIATTMIWAMTALIKNPSAMKKAQAELRASFGKKQMVEEEDLAVAHMPYLNAVIKEAMRLYSTAWAISKDPEQWKNPNEFLPERFLEGGKCLSMDLKGQDYRFIPFGAGRRICPGMTMAMATVETVPGNLLYLFDWELPAGVRKEDVDNDILPSMTLHEKNPLYLLAKEFI
ncbi:Cytochrome P450 CYP2 subfamily [Handroanthus impetiginosus]|uniref:Cytochrome P450 CYP2 subfamily n=1 Tax=Handroanthus impetiginosus TaxID=429701 RepID=A0A2G9FX07_9LAMI|nr:Cytochrome P450 CYP2 subfamily [Handroanthus impetiginosus]